MKKKVLSLLLVLVFLLGLLPTMALATDNTLNFSTNLNSEYTTSSGSPFQLSVAVGSYTPAGGEATLLPAGTAITYQWYKSTDDQIDASDSKVYSQQNYGFQPEAGKNWYYVTATATIEDIEYTGTSNVACVKVPAAAKSVKVTVNDQGILGFDKDGAAVGGKAVSVADVNCDNKQTVDEVLLAAHKALLSADAYATTGSEGDLTITKIWNKQTENFAVYLNGAKVTGSVDTVAIKAGDVVCISLNSGESDKYVAFDTVATTVSENKEFTLTLKDDTGTAAAGLPVGLWKDGAFEQLGDKVTGENGQVTLSFAAAGDYVVTAKASSEETPITAPACAVTVKEKGELRFYGSLPTTTQVCYVGEQLAFTIQKDGYYINNVRQNGVSNSAYTLTWYRIGADGQPQNLSTSITGKMTAADVGTWKYYAVLSGEIYGDQYNTMSDFVTVIVKEPTLPEGSAENGFVTGFESYTLGMDGLTFEKGKTDYALTEFDVGTNERLDFNYAGSGLWCGVRVNGIKGTTSDYELTHTLYATGSFKIPTTFAAGQTNVVSLLVGTKYDSNGSGTIDANDDFDRYDVYNFTVTTLPGVAPITVKNSDNTAITLSKPISTSKNYFVKETSGTRTTDTVKLTATFKAANGVKLYVGDTEYTANLSNTEIDLASFKDGNGVAAVPLTAKYVGEGGAVFENTITLTLNPAADFAAPVIKTQPAAESTVAKDGTVPLSVEAETPAEGTTLSYQWVKGLSSYAITNNAYTVIDGATSTSYVAPGEEAAKDMYYFCLVTLRKGGASATTASNAAKVTTELTYVNAPVITIQPGICGNKSGGGTYCTEYTAGSAFDPMWMGVASESDGHSQVTELGCAPFLNNVKCYYNTVPSTEGGILVDGTAAIAGTGSYGSYFSFTPTAGLPEGINYVYFVVTTTAADDPTKSASTTTDFVKLNYGKADFGFEGSGTAEDPYLLKTGNDFVTIRRFVEELGINCSGICFKMANDITLPADWQSIGTNGAGGKFFGGTLDGDGHTLSYAKGSPSLIYHAKGAVITNLKVYGEEIQGPALISSSWINQTMGAWIAEISNVTLASGSSTLESGLVNGSASTYNPITITNCTVEEGVTIGYDKTKNNVGSIAGGFIGSISNCRSAATVYGNNNVGGIVGISANSMGAGNLTNCVFTGKIVATGNNVGGIQGSGYVAESAPNALCVCIQNCYVNAEITGKNNVGGMLGGDPGILQAWDNGPGNIRNNLFYGKLTGDSNVGGMVGYYASLNRNNHISDNYFYDANGHENIIGGVKYIDTSAHEYGLGADGIFYFDTSRDDLETLKQVVDAEKIGTSGYQYTSIAKKDQNRSDDPMGKDQAAFGRIVTSSELTDGTVLNLLNNGEASMKNWAEGTVCPVIDNRPIATEIAVTGDFKSEYYIGEALDLSGAVFTVTFSDGTTKTVPAEDVVVTGFDSSARAVLSLTVSYQSVSTTISVKVLQKPMVNTITVYFTLLGDTLHEGDNTIHTLTGGNLNTWIARESYEMDINATVKDLLGAVEKRHSNVKFNGKGSQYGTYVESVTYGDLTIGEFDNTATSGWMVTINGKHPDVGVDYEFLNNGDKVIFHFTDDYSKEQGGEEWNDPGTNPGEEPEAPISPVTEPEQPSGEVKVQEYAAESGKIPVIVNADGTKTVIKKSYQAGENIYALIPDGAKVEFIDNAKSFTDVKEGDWYTSAVDFVSAHELFIGVSDTEFAPDMSMSRAMLVTVLYRLEDTPDFSVETAFSDVENGDWYADAVLWAMENHITEGMGNGSFGADLNVTREQIATFLYRYAKYIGLDVSTSGELAKFPDGKNVSVWAQEAMRWAIGEKLFRGDGHGALNPTENATRAQVATLLMRMMELIVK